MKKMIKIGLIQMRCGKNPADNLARAIQRIARLAKRGAQIICLPELFKTQYFCQTKNDKFFQLAEKISGSLTIRALSKYAKKNKVVVIASVYEKSLDKKFFNTAVVIDTRGKISGRYRKMYIPDDMKNHYGESYYFTPGNLGFKVFKVAGVKIGVLVCWDQWFPEAARILATSGAQIIFYPTAIGFQVKDKFGVNNAEYKAWQIIQQSHAIANNIFIAAANRVGIENFLHFWGTSFVSDPYGQIIAKAPSDKEANILVDCDLSLINQMRHDWPFLKSRRIKLVE